MRTKISSENPYRHNRHGFAWEKVPRGGVAHLDFGCYDGGFLNSLRAKAVGRLVGVDASRQAVADSLARNPDLEIVHITESVPLPFEDGTFSSISIMDVLEHVSRQEELLTELSRVLKDDGILIITLPGEHIFSVLDMGNFKFRFPKLHQWYYCWRHSRKEYEDRYVSNPDGLVGDISAEKRWHEHFSRKKLGNLLERCGLEAVEFDGAALFHRPLVMYKALFNWIRLLRPLVGALDNLDARWFASAHLFCVARKKQPPSD